MANDGKLYTKSNCSVCLGNRKNNCYYCDTNGLHFIEASDRIVVELLNSKSDEELNEIKSKLRNT